MYQQPTTDVRNNQMYNNFADELIEKLQMASNSKVSGMLRYLILTYSVPKNVFNIDYFGHPKCLQSQLLCHAIHEMRHAEMFSRSIVRLGGIPRIDMANFLVPQVYGQLFQTIVNEEMKDIQRLKELQGKVNDNELGLMLSISAKEDDTHLKIFPQIIDILTQAGMYHQELPSPAGNMTTSRDVSLLQKVFQLELESIVNLIFLSLVLGADQSLAPRFRFLSIEDMQHLNGLAEQIMILGARPEFPAKTFNISESGASLNQKIRHNIDIKQQKISQFSRHIEQLQSQGAVSFLQKKISKERENIEDLKAYAHFLQKQPLTIH